jgi:hypothetical protein
MRVSERHGKESASVAWPPRAALRILTLFALLLSLTLAAAPSADASAGAFIKAYGWGVVDGMSQFETCTSTCQAGMLGGGAGELFYALGVAIDPSGDVYVADTNNERIDEFSAAGAFIKAYGWGVSDGASRFETCTNTCQRGIPGGGAGQLYNPEGVATNSSGDVYVADSSDERIDEFSAAGAFIKAYGWGVVDGMSQFETCTSTCQAGIPGGGAGQFDQPGGVATDSSGDVYVADSYYGRIDEFSAAGAFIKAYGWGVVDGMSKFETCTSTCQAGISGGGAGQFDGPAGVATDSSGDVYVADYRNARIDEFSAAGAFIKAYGWGVADGASQFETCTSTCQTGIYGGGAGQFDDPSGVAVDPSGDVYVADTFDDRIDEFSAAGAFIKAYGWGVVDEMSQFETCTTTCQAGIAGGGAGQLYTPWGVATDSSGDVYVADSLSYRIDEFSAAGALCASAPSITTQPAAQTVTAPAAATFTAAGSTPANCSAPGVQWSSEAPGATSFSPIPGATSTSYKTPATTTAQSGTKYEATFANAVGSTTTSAATLTVVNAAGGGGSGGGGAGTPRPAPGWHAGLSLGGGPLTSALTVGVDAAGDEFVFWQGADRGLWEKYYIGGKWSAPVRISSAGTIASAPAVAVRGVHQQDVFWKGLNGHLREARYTHGWHTSVDLGAGGLTSAPTVGVDAAGDEFVFWQGAGSRLWEKSYHDGRWNRAVRVTIARKIGSAPAVAVHANGQADVFWKGTDGNLWEAVYSHGWRAEINLGGRPLGSAPAAGVDSAGEEFVFWRGTDGGLWENFYLHSRWNSPIRITIAGTIGSAPAVAVHPTGQQDVFWKGVDSNLWESFYQPS